MPLDNLPEQEFSYERNVAPYANRFFNEIESDSRLSQQAKTRLQGTLLSGIEDIEKQRMAIQEERDKGRLRSLQYAQGVSALEDARAKRLRLAAVDAYSQNTAKRVQQVIADPNIDPDTKHQILSNEELNNPLIGSPSIRRIFDAGRKALPERTKQTGFTPTQVAKFVADGVPPEVLATGDPVLIGQYAGFAAYKEEQLKKDEDHLKRNSTGAEQLRRSLLTKDLSFEKDEVTKADSPWMKPDSTTDADRIVTAFGTPEERKKFDALKSAPSDRERYDLVTAIQRRELALRLGAAESRGNPKETAASMIGQ